MPVPIYCRPLGGESELGMKIWSATAVDLTGGEAGFPISNGTSGRLVLNREINLTFFLFVF